MIFKGIFLQLELKFMNHHQIKSFLLLELFGIKLGHNNFLDSNV